MKWKSLRPGTGVPARPRPSGDSLDLGLVGPDLIANAAYKKQRRNPGVTEFVKMPNRGHALTIDHGWREVAQTALDFVKRFA